MEKPYYRYFFVVFHFFFFLIFIPYFFVEGHLTAWLLTFLWIMYLKKSFFPHCFTSKITTFSLMMFQNFTPYSLPTFLWKGTWKPFFYSLVLVQPRKTLLDMTEKLLAGTQRIKKMILIISYLKDS